MQRIRWRTVCGDVLLIIIVISMLGRSTDGYGSYDAVSPPVHAAPAGSGSHAIWLPLLAPVIGAGPALSPRGAIRQELRPTSPAITTTATVVPTTSHPDPMTPTTSVTPTDTSPPTLDLPLRNDKLDIMTHTTELDVRGAPSLTAAQVDAILARAGSPATGTGVFFEHYSRASGIDSAIALAFFFQESSAGTAGVHMPFTHNIGNIVCAGYPTCHGRWRSYPTWAHGIADWYRLIAVEYIQQRGTVTVEQILPIYAPAFENDVPRYIRNVRSWIAQWRGQPLPVVPVAPATVISALPSPTPTPAPAREPPVLGAVQLPDLVGLDQHRAQEHLATLGITTVITDIQGRDHLGAVFDQHAPHTVVSSQPAPAAWVQPAETVVLGVRGSDTPVVVAGPGDGVAQPLPTPIPLPDVVGLTQENARAALHAHGIPCIVIDIQGRDHLGDEFNRTAPDTVVSSQPPAATHVNPDTVVVLGVRCRRCCRKPETRSQICTLLPLRTQAQVAKLQEHDTTIWWFVPPPYIITWSD